jgi:urease accessory protein
MTRRIIITLALSGALVSPALAHPGMGHTHSFGTGLAHPLSGADHILAMLTVGFWGVLAGGRVVGVWPLAFVATMLVGFAAAALGLQIPFVEPAVSSSVIVLGLCVALAVRAPVWAGAAIAGLFAFFHGHAHGTEVTTANVVTYAAGVSYVVGFTFATAWILSAGIGLGVVAEGLMGRIAVRVMGGLAALSGVVLMAG